MLAGSLHAPAWGHRIPPATQTKSRYGRVWASKPDWKARSRVRNASRCIRVLAYLQGEDDSHLEEMKVKVAIVGSGPAAHTAAIYLGRAELQPVLFEGWMANGIAPGGQLTTTTYVENFPGFPEPILGLDLTENFRKQSVAYGCKIFTETVNKLHLVHGTPFTLWTDTKKVVADAVIIATGAAAKRLKIPGCEEGTGFWQKGISACAVCDGSSPMFRNQPVAVIGGGDAAMEEACFLSRYASTVYIIHRFDTFEASRVMQKRALSNPKIQVLWQHEVMQAYGLEGDDVLGGVKVRDNSTGQVRDLPLSGLFFAIGHEPATAFLGGQLELDEFKYIVTAPDSTACSIPGVFAAGDVQDRKWRQAITAAGTGCMAALEVERFLSELHSGSGPAAAMAAASGQEGPLNSESGQHWGCASCDDEEGAAAGAACDRQGKAGQQQQQQQVQARR